MNFVTMRAIYVITCVFFLSVITESRIGGRNSMDCTYEQIRNYICNDEIMMERMGSKLMSMSDDCKIKMAAKVVAVLNACDSFNRDADVEKACIAMNAASKLMKGCHPRKGSNRYPNSSEELRMAPQT